MNLRCATLLLLGGWIGAAALAQTAPSNPANPAGGRLAPLIPLEWIPPALVQLDAQAAAKSSFTLDRAMLNAAAGMSGPLDDPTRQAINRLDGVSVHFLRFAAEATADPALLEAVRNAYHLRGWKHVVTTTQAGGPVHDGDADVWVIMQGLDVRGAVVLMQSANTLTLATVAGNLSPADLLHLRGHFGIPRFAGDGLENR